MIEYSFKVFFLYSRRLLSLFIILLSFYSSQAQKPKVGLVLSGGGAKGMAHVGVLKQLENAGIRPDFIAGTSMGSIVGAMYAIGYNADQIEAILREIDWDLILSNNIPLNYISYEEKEYYNRYLLEFPFQKGQINLPSGLIEGQMLSEAISHYTWPSMFYKNFDDFPIPFRCVGTNVSNGQPIVFKDGSLAEALRASMAIPTAFTAAEWDSTLVVDGGIVNNFPADILKDLGAEIIIGMNVTRGFKDASKVNDLAGILMQMTMISSNEKLANQKAMCDVYIEPNLDEYNTASFSKYDEIMAIGRAAAELYAKKLDSISRISGKSEPPDGIEKSAEDIVASSVNLNGNELFTDDLVMGKLGFEAGDTVNHEEIEEGVRSVFGINGFYKVEYSINQIDDKLSFRLKMKEKPPTTVKASFHYDNTFSAGIVLNITARDLLFKSSRTIVAGDISENPKFRFDYYKYVGPRKRAALNLRYNYMNEQLPIYVGGEKIDVQINAENEIAINLISTQNLRRSFFLGANFENNRFKSQFAGYLPNEFEYADFDHTQLVVGYMRNTLDNPNYPVKGTDRFLMIEGVVQNNYEVKFKNPNDSLVFHPRSQEESVYLKNEEDANNLLNEFTPGAYGRIYFRTIEYKRLAKKFQMIPRLALGLTISNDTINAIFQDFYIGGNQMVRRDDSRFYGLNYGEQLAYNFGLIGLNFQHVIGGHIFFKYGVNFLGWNPHIRISDPSTFDASKFWSEQTILGYGVQATYKSFVGPISFGLSTNTTDGYVRGYFAIGFSFNYSD